MVSSVDANRLMTRRQIALLIASLLVSGLFLWLALRDVPLAEVAANIRSADWGWVALSFAFATGALFVRGLRWRALLDGRVSVWRAFLMFSVTMLLNQLPLRIGEVGRVVLTAREGIPLGVGASAVIFERLVDTLLVVAALALALARLPEVPPLIAQTLNLFAFGVAVGFALILLVARRPQIGTAALNWAERRLPFIWRLIARFNPRKFVGDIQTWLQGMVTLRKLSTLTGWTLIGWACSFATFYCLQSALGIANIDAILAMVLGVTLATFTVAIPVSVASVGPFQGAVRAAGDLVGMSPAASAALGFVVHGMTVFSYAVWGVIGLIALGVALGEVVKKRGARPAQPEAP
jgi:uncharacterized protein (TIRG00374 family)